MIEPECHSDIVYALLRWVVDVVYVYRYFWPDIHHLFHRFPGRVTGVLQVQVTRRCKRKISPSSAYVYQCKPRAIIDEEFENFEEKIIREESDCDLLVKLAYTAHP